MDQKIVNQFKKIINDALVNVATKEDLVALKNELIQEIRDSEGFVTGNVDQHKADKYVLEDLQKRVTKIEQKLAH